MSSMLAPLLIVLALISIHAVLARRPHGHRLPLPPTPPRLLHLLHSTTVPKRPWLLLLRSDGDVVCRKRGRTIEIYLLSQHAAKDLIEGSDGRSRRYASRPKAVFAWELATQGLGVAMCPYGELFRAHRKVFTAALGSSVVPRYDAVVARHLHDLEGSLVQSPADFMQHIRHFSAAVILDTTYAISISKDDPLVAEMINCNSFFLDASRRGALLDHYPILQLLPTFLSPWKRLARQWCHRELGFFRVLLERSRAAGGVSLADSTSSSPPCARAIMDEMQSDVGLSDDQAAFLMGSFYGAGVEAMASALYTFVLAMMTHPDVVTRARSEIADIVGDRPVDHSDLDALPYCRAILVECLRWRPFAPMSAPYAAAEEDTYQGMRIPKGASIFASVWTMTRREGNDDFDPRLPNDDEAEERIYAFGFGRRICPGQHFALRTLTLAIARLVQGFDFFGDRGTDTMRYSDIGLISLPEPFKCDIRPVVRSS